MRSQPLGGLLDADLVLALKSGHDSQSHTTGWELVIGFFLWHNIPNLFHHQKIVINRGPSLPLLLDAVLTCFDPLRPLDR